MVCPVCGLQSVEGICGCFELDPALADEARADLARAAEIWGDLRFGTLLSIGFAMCLVILGRIKPRLGQDYGRTFGSRRDAVAAADLSAMSEQPTHFKSI